MTTKAVNSAGRYALEAYICDECIDVCDDIIAEETGVQHRVGFRRPTLRRSIPLLYAVFFGALLTFFSEVKFQTETLPKEGALTRDYRHTQESTASREKRKRRQELDAPAGVFGIRVRQATCGRLLTSSPSPEW